MVFRNKHGSYYTSTTLRSYFNESIVKIDPIERVEYRNPFLCEAPKTNKLSLIEQLIIAWEPVKTPITFSANILRQKDADWWWYVRVKVTLFVEWIRYSRKSEEDVKAYSYKKKQLVSFCDEIGWLDLKEELII